MPVQWTKGSVETSVVHIDGLFVTPNLVVSRRNAQHGHRPLDGTAMSLVEPYDLDALMGEHALASPKVSVQVPFVPLRQHLQLTALFTRTVILRTVLTR